MHRGKERYIYGHCLERCHSYNERIIIINNIDQLNMIIDIFHIRLNQNCIIRKITGKMR